MTFLHLTSQLKSTIRHYSLRGLLIFATALLLTSCQSQSGQEVQNLAATSGFGGTGVIAEDPSSGFGGTGRASSGFGGTGVIGTITKFGSIWVNGIEIGYGDQTKITSDLKKNDVLKLGQQVILETMSREDKALTKAIHIYYPLAGKITAMTKNGLVINGQYTVLITEKTKLDATIELKVGQFITLSGYQTADQSWTATRLNNNEDKVEFYHPTPTRDFSKAVKRVIIESNVKQLSQWQKLSKKSIIAGDKIDQSKRLIVEGYPKNGMIESTVITAYGSYVQHQTTENMSDKPSQKQAQDKLEALKSQQESRQLQQEQMEVMQMQKEQQSIIQDQIEQMQQMQDIQEQYQQIQSIKGQVKGLSP